MCAVARTGDAGCATLAQVQRPALRLAVFVTVLALLGLLTLVFLPFSADGLQESMEPYGLLAAPVVIVVGSLLGLVFFPGPVLAAVNGALFGTGLGFVCGLIGSVLTSVLALLIARRAAAPAVEELSNERIQALTDLARTNGTLAVTVQRLIPGVPDAPLSYAFGLLGLKAHQIALGTLIGTAPRGFAYTALGDAAVNGDGRLALVATGVGTAVSLIGVIIGGLLVRRHRRRTDQARLEGA